MLDQEHRLCFLSDCNCSWTKCSGVLIFFILMPFGALLRGTGPPEDVNQQTSEILRRRRLLKFCEDYQRRYYEERHMEVPLVYQQRYVAGVITLKMKEYQRELRDEDKTKVKEYDRRYYEENKMKVKEYNRRYREENKMKMREKGGDNLWNEKTKTGDREGEKAEDEIWEIVSV